MSPDVLLECPRTSFRDVLRVNVTERVWIFPLVEGKLSLTSNHCWKHRCWKLLQKLLSRDKCSFWQGLLHIGIGFSKTTKTRCQMPAQNTSTPIITDAALGQDEIYFGFSLVPRVPFASFSFDVFDPVV